MSLRNTIAKNVRAVRTQLGMTLEELEKKSRLSAQYINRLERSGDINLTADNLEKLAKGLDISPTLLVATIGSSSSSDTGQIKKDSESAKKDLESSLKLLQRSIARLK